MRLARYFAAASALALQGCAGLQSALDPSGAEAERIGTLSWLLVLFSTAILVAVCLITAVALFGGERWRARIAGERIVIGGGLVFRSWLSASC